MEDACWCSGVALLPLAQATFDLCSVSMMKSQDYQRILEKHLQPSILQSLVQQDNYLRHQTERMN